MDKNKALKILNPVIGLLLLSQACTGLLGEHLPEEMFEAVHGGGGLLLAAGAALHLYLNRAWIKATYFGPRP